MRFSRRAYWVGWWHWHIGFGVRGKDWQLFIGFGYNWAPRYCITWFGPWSFWHMHDPGESEMTTGWETNFERLDVSEPS